MSKRPYNEENMLTQALSLHLGYAVSVIHISGCSSNSDCVTENVTHCSLCNTASGQCVGNYYVLVICNHCLHCRGIAGSLKSPTLRGLLAGKTTVVFPRSLLSFHFTPLFMPPTLKKLEGHIAFGLSVCLSVCVCVRVYVC